MTGKKQRYDPERHCGHAKRCGPNRGEPCLMAKGWGTDHYGFGRCRKHLGNTPTHRKAAKLQKVQKEVDAIILYGPQREVTPHEALLEEIWRTAGIVSWLEGKVREYGEADDLVWGVVETEEGTRGSTVKQAARPSVWLTLFQKERRHLVDVSRVAIAAGIAERQVKLAEQQGAIIAEVLRGTLKDLGIKDDAKVAKVLRKHLVAVSARTE